MLWTGTAPCTSSHWVIAPRLTFPSNLLPKELAMGTNPQHFLPGEQLHWLPQMCAPVHHKQETVLRHWQGENLPPEDRPSLRCPYLFSQERKRHGTLPQIRKPCVQTLYPKRSHQIRLSAARTLGELYFGTAQRGCGALQGGSMPSLVGPRREAMSRQGVALLSCTLE